MLKHWPRLWRAPLRRGLSSSSSSGVVSTEMDKDRIVTVTMQNNQLNIFDYELASTLHKTLADLEEKETRGLILTSAYPKTFTAGLDMSVLYKPKYDKFKEWWKDLQGIFLKLYGSTAPSVAAITGYGAGYGTLLACACEYRVMVYNAENSKGSLLGYHEVKFGFNPPPWFIYALTNVLPRRDAELAVTQGTLFSPMESLKLGLVDELATDKEEAIEKSKLWLSKFSDMSLIGRTHTKRIYRHDGLSFMHEHGEEDVEKAFEFASSESYCQAIEKYIKSIKK